MCWSETASYTMVALGSVGTGVCYMRGEPRGIWITLGYFTGMEALQAAGYGVVDQCGDPANRTITLLSYLHIVFQPLFINAFAMELVPCAVKARIRRWVWVAAGSSAAVMLLQIAPIDWAGTCRPGTPLCGPAICLVSGEWHIAWEMPYNGLLNPVEDLTGIGGGFPTYMIAVFVVPLVYGAWRFVVFHALAGPVAASLLTSNPNEMPAVWCLFSIGVLAIALSPAIRQQFETSTWPVWPRSWQV